jgi:hypothetical protein
MSSLQQLKQQSAGLEGEQGCFLAPETISVAVVSPVKAQSTRNDCPSFRHIFLRWCNLIFILFECEGSLLFNSPTIVNAFETWFLPTAY